MTSPRRSLQARLALFYAAGVFVAGLLVLAIVDVTIAGAGSTKPAGDPASSTLTGSGHGVAPQQLLLGSAAAVAILIPAALALGWWMAGRFLRPLRAITASANAISAGNLDQRLDLGEPADELTELGHTLDRLFARLQAAFDAQRHFVANASHELRTPLAGLRTVLEVTLANPKADSDTLRTACREALALGEQQERLVTALLALARSERGVDRWEPVDLAGISQNVLTSHRDQATRQGVRLVDRRAPAVTAGDPRLIESLIANLVDNGIRHNHPDGYVELDTRSTDARAILTVTNSGPVIPQDQLQRLLQPFQQLSPGRDSHGLGLAIVNAVTQAHHATIATHARPEGGLRVQIDFAT